MRQSEVEMEGTVTCKGLEVGRSLASSRNWQMTSYDEEMVYKKENQLAQFREVGRSYLCNTELGFDFTLTPTRNRLKDFRRLHGLICVFKNHFGCW